jgi:regulator of sigma E protease
MSFSEIAIIVTQFLLSLSLLIILHEWGHYFPAKKFKTKVEKFYLFFDAWGKKLFSFKYKGTEYGIGWLPLGGYVKIAGMIDESMDKEQMKEEPKPWEFRSKPAWQRLVIMLGGVVVNFVLAYVILVFVSFGYGDKYIPASELKEGILVSDFIEKEVGLKNGDKIISIDGKKVENTFEITKNILLGETITINRNGETKKINIPVDITGKTIDADAKSFVSIPLPIVIEKVPDSSHNFSKNIKPKSIVKSINGIAVSSKNFTSLLQKNTSQTIKLATYDLKGTTEYYAVDVDDKGKIGAVVKSIGDLDELNKIGFYHVEIKDYSFFESFAVGGTKFVSRFDDMLKNVKVLLNSHKTGAAKGLGSFVSIAKIFPTTWNWQGFWNITAFLSIMLGVLNLLPIPALDGGHAMFVLYEMIFKRKPGEKFLEYAQMVGFVLLITLFVYAFGNDIYRHFIK